MLIDNFEQHFESCILNAQNSYKSAQNQINSLDTSKNEPMKIFCSFWVFEYAIKPGNVRNQQKAFQIKKTPLLTVTSTRKLLK